MISTIEDLLLDDILTSSPEKLLRNGNIPVQSATQQIAPRNIDAFDAARVATIKAQIAAGDYLIDEAAIARHMLNL